MHYGHLLSNKFMCVALARMYLSPFHSMCVVCVCVWLCVICSTTRQLGIVGMFIGILLLAVKHVCQRLAHISIPLMLPLTTVTPLATTQLTALFTLHFVVKVVTWVESMDSWASIHLESTWQHSRTWTHPCICPGQQNMQVRDTYFSTETM